MARSEALAGLRNRTMMLILGGAAWWSRIATRDYPQPMPVMVTFTVAHVVVGALTLAGTVVVAVVSYRLLTAPQTASVAERHAPEAAPAR